MAGFDRKMLALLKPNSLDKALLVLEKSAICFTCSPGKCPYKCRYINGNSPMLPPPPPPIVTGDKYQMPSYFILMICVLGAIFVFICYIITLRRYKYNSRSRANPQSWIENGEDFIDENHGPVLDHPIWYIRTVGLPQNIIDSIAVFKYKKYEALIEGTDCSVCLSEFEEDESLKLLPKCSHAFHIPCIDTWLRSHKNCPLCRAPIVSDMAQMNVEILPITNADDASPNVVNQTENGTNSDQPENLEFNEEGNRETRVEVENLDALPIEEGSMMCTLKGKSSVLDERMKGVRVSSDLEQNHETRLGVEYVDALPVDEGRRIGIWGRIPSVLDEWKKGVRVCSDLAEHRVKATQELQPPRRSVSMDASTAQVNRVDTSDMNVRNSERCCSSNDQVAEGKIESSDVMTEEGNRNPSLYKPMKSSFSTSGKWSQVTTSKNQDLRQTL